MIDIYCKKYLESFYKTDCHLLKQPASRKFLSSNDNQYPWPQKEKTQYDLIPNHEQIGTLY